MCRACPSRHPFTPRSGRACPARALASAEKAIQSGVGGGYNVVDEYYIKPKVAINEPPPPAVDYLAANLPGRDGHGYPPSDSRPERPAAGTAATPKKKPIPTNFVSIVSGRAGTQTLVIAYPWKIHQQASVEVRLLTGEHAEGTIVTPLYFTSEYFKGQMWKKIYHCLDGAADSDMADSLLLDKIDFHIIARRNSLGRPAVLVIPEDKATKLHGKEAEFTAALRAVFPLLDAWAVNDRLLTLDLPRGHVFPAGSVARLVLAWRPSAVGRDGRLAGKVRGRRKVEGSSLSTPRATAVSAVARRPAEFEKGRIVGLTTGFLKIPHRSGVRTDWNHAYFPCFWRFRAMNCWFLAGRKGAFRGR